jgi:hypothetical protein
MRRLQITVGFAIVTITCGMAWAQVDQGREIREQQQLNELQEIELDSRILANQAIPVGQRALIDYGGYIIPQYFSVDDSSQNNHTLREYELVGYMRLNFDGANEFFLRASTEYNDYSAGDSFDGLGSRWINPDFDRIYYKFDLAKYEAAYHGKSMDGNLPFEGGRDLVYWGNGLAIAEVLDGIMPSVSYGPLTINGVAGVTPVRTVDFEPDRPAFDTNTLRGFYGAMLTANVLQQHPYIYGMIQRDYNGENASQVGPISTRYSYNSDYLAAGSTGAISDHLGNDLSDSSTVSGFSLVQVAQTRDNIRAYAGDLKIDYVPQDVQNSRISIEGIAASGDSDRGLTNTTFNGNAPNTPDQAFNGFGLLSTGLAFAAPVSNLFVIRVGGSTFPFPNSPGFRKLQVGTDIYSFNKENATAPIDEFTNPGVSHLGWEPDFYLNWEMASDITLTLRYGVFMPNTYAFPSDKARQFLYAGTTIAF